MSKIYDSKEISCNVANGQTEPYLTVVASYFSFFFLTSCWKESAAQFELSALVYIQPCIVSSLCAHNAQPVDMNKDCGQRFNFVVVCIENSCFCQQERRDSDYFKRILFVFCFLKSKGKKKCWILFSGSIG